MLHTLPYNESSVLTVVSNISKKANKQVSAVRLGRHLKPLSGQLIVVD